MQKCVVHEKEKCRVGMLLRVISIQQEYRNIYTCFKLEVVTLQMWKLFFILFLLASSPIINISGSTSMLKCSHLRSFDPIRLLVSFFLSSSASAASSLRTISLSTVILPPGGFRFHPPVPPRKPLLAVYTMGFMER